jgi:hypothetical protein
VIVTFGRMERVDESTSSMDVFADGAFVGTIDTETEDISSSRTRAYRVRGYSVNVTDDPIFVVIQAGESPRTALARAKGDAVRALTAATNPGPRSKLCQQGRHDFDPVTAACRRRDCPATLTLPMFAMSQQDEEQAYGFSVEREAQGFKPGDDQLGLFGNPPPLVQPRFGGSTERTEEHAIYRHKACEKRLGKKVVWRVAYVVDVERAKIPDQKWGGFKTRITRKWWAVHPSTGREYAFEGPPTTPCPECGQHVSGEAIHGVHNDAVPCTAKCVAALGPSCECSCGGRNHGASWGG